MRYYFAPLEGITGYVFRRVHHELFGEGVDRYFTPFVVANYTKKLKTRERMDVLPENNRGVPVVPQILANEPAIFLATARAMADLGYEEVNINLGCPVGTVVSKHKGSGMLQFPDELDRFLDGVYNGAEQIRTSQGQPLRISIKTRLGFDSVGEAGRIFAIYERYPIAELIIHARTRRELYSGQPELAVFMDILQNSRLPLCYNGNIYTVQDDALLRQRLEAAASPRDCAAGTAPDSAVYPDSPVNSVNSVNCMIGRGLLQNPGLVREILTGRKTTREELHVFHDRLLSGYEEQYASFHGQTSGQTVIVNRMKEVWTHLGHSFADDGRYLKAIHKARNMTEYAAAVRVLFANCGVKEPENGLLP